MTPRHRAACRAWSVVAPTAGTAVARHPGAAAPQQANVPLTLVPSAR
jgi:hypothetical protein